MLRMTCPLADTAGGRLCNEPSPVNGHSMGGRNTGSDPRRPLFGFRQGGERMMQVQAA